MQLAISDTHEGLKDVICAVSPKPCGKDVRFLFWGDILTHVPMLAQTGARNLVRTVAAQPIQERAKALLKRVS